MHTPCNPSAIALTTSYGNRKKLHYAVAPSLDGGAIAQTETCSVEQVHAKVVETYPAPLPASSVIPLVGMSTLTSYTRKRRNHYEYNTAAHLVGSPSRCFGIPPWELGSGGDAAHLGDGGGAVMESFLDRLKSSGHREHTYVRHLLPVSLRFQYDAESDTVLVLDELNRLLSHEDAKDVIAELRSYMSQFSNKNIELINERKESDRNLNLLDYKKPLRVSLGWIYLAQALGTSRYKIGKSKNPASRLKDLREQSAHPIELVHQIQCPDMLLAERSLHQRFAKYRVHGEWFELPQEAVNYVCSLEAL